MYKRQPTPQLGVFQDQVNIEAGRWDASIAGWLVTARIGLQEQGAVAIPHAAILAPPSGTRFIRDFILAVKETTLARRNGGHEDSKFITIRYELFRNGLISIRPLYFDSLPDPSTTLHVYPMGVFQK